jgi:hypothetical protein
LEERIGELGFRNDISEGAPVCRWVSPNGFLLDLMPVDPGVLGFSNRWYEEAAARAEPRKLRPGLTILVPPPPVFMASKLEAFRNRGEGDLLGSHDLEDVISLVAGRPEIVDEVDREGTVLREWIRQHLRDLTTNPDFIYALQGALPDAALLPAYREEVRNRFELLSE